MHNPVSFSQIPVPGLVVAGLKVNLSLSLHAQFGIQDLAPTIPHYKLPNLGGNESKNMELQLAT